MRHFWEEPCLVGDGGAGAVFFGGCPLACIFCQNAPLSHGGAGKHYAEEELVAALLDLQRAGAVNIDLVSATPYAHILVRVIREARARGLSLPIVWNTSGYETEETVEYLHGTVDVYMPDLKTLSRRRAAAYLHAPDYPDTARRALRRMYESVGNPRFDGGGLMTGGMLVRHLVMPRAEHDSMRVLDHLASYGDGIYVSLMSQYTPPEREIPDYPELSLRVNPTVYRRLVRYAETVGIAHLYTQSFESASESFIPLWDTDAEE